MSVGKDMGITISESSLRIPARVTDFSLLHRPALELIQRPAPRLQRGCFSKVKAAGV